MCGHPRMRTVMLLATVLAACRSYTPDRTQETINRIRHVGSLLEQRFLERGCLPLSVEDWVLADSAVAKHSKDAWKRPLLFRFEGRAMRITSAGNDGVFGSGDDIEGGPILLPDEIDQCQVQK